MKIVAVISLEHVEGPDTQKHLQGFEEMSTK